METSKNESSLETKDSMSLEAQRETFVASISHDLKNPTGERKEEIEKKIIDRCGVVPLIAMIIAAGIVAMIGSNYYTTGGLTFVYLYVACFPLIYQIMAVIVIRLEVQDAKLVRKVELFEKEEIHHE